MNNSNVIAFKTRGQLAWLKIKSIIGTESYRDRHVEEMRLWRDIGEALLVGRKLHPSNQKFSQWLKDNEFGDMDRRVRADAMWCISHTSLNDYHRWGHPREARELITMMDGGPRSKDAGGRSYNF